MSGKVRHFKHSGITEKSGTRYLSDIQGHFLENFLSGRFSCRGNNFSLCKELHLLQNVQEENSIQNLRFETVFSCFIDCRVAGENLC
jgi:hypothetical protein